MIDNLDITTLANQYEIDIKSVTISLELATVLDVTLPLNLIELTDKLETLLQAVAFYLPAIRIAMQSAKQQQIWTIPVIFSPIGPQYKLRLEMKQDSVHISLNQT